MQLQLLAHIPRFSLKRYSSLTLERARDSQKESQRERERARGSQRGIEREIFGWRDVTTSSCLVLGRYNSKDSKDNTNATFDLVDKTALCNFTDEQLN